jgi:zinc/manganese transport system substrate-binding protein
MRPPEAWMKQRLAGLLVLALVTAVLAMGCHRSSTATAPAAATAPASKPVVVATYSVLAAVVADLAGDALVVTTAIPNGLDPHEWEPSAKDIEALNNAALVVENGLGLEGGMEKVLARAKSSGKKFFTASDHIAVRRVGKGEGIPSGDPDQAVGAEDPHLWMDPVAIKAVVQALAMEIKSSLGIDLDARARDLASRLDALDAEVRATVASIPAENRKLVTGHESMGYFAQRYGFRLVGAVVPSLSTQAETSAAEMHALERLIADNRVKAVFMELGTPPGVGEALSREARVRTVELTTHVVPADGSYFTFVRNLARTIAEALK